MIKPWLLAFAVCAVPALAQDPTSAASPATATAVPAPPAPVDVNPAPTAAPVATSDKEEVCNDKLDNDGDAVVDCGDSDCASQPYCKADGKAESGNARCSDWVDNDGDGQIDCEDKECQLSSVTVCRGSWKGDYDGTGGNADTATAANGLGGETEPADVDGQPRRVYGGDVEQPDSEEGVGFVGIRFGIVAAVQQLYTSTNAANQDVYDQRLDTRFDTLQLRAFGNLPLLEDSFFLISIQAAQSPRVTFALFQFPLGNGHYVNVNTGGSTLSAQPLISSAKRPLLDTPRYLLSAFDQFLDAGVELNGPIVLNLLRYRVFAGGGTGLFGDAGGRFFEDASINPTYSAGGQLWLTPIGIYNRFDSPFLYRPVPQALSFALGAKYEQREAERFPAAHAVAVYRNGIFAVQAESYAKGELNYGTVQNANYLQVGVLAIPEWLFLAADVGNFMSTDPNQLESSIGYVAPGKGSTQPNALLRQQNQWQARAAAHWFFWRQNGVITARYSFTNADPVPLGAQRDRDFPVVTNEVVLQAQLRF